MNQFAGQLVESFKTDLFIIRGENNVGNLIICRRALGGADNDKEGGDTVDKDIFLRLPCKLVADEESEFESK